MIPRVKDGHACFLKIFYIAGYNTETVNIGEGCDEQIGLTKCVILLTPFLHHFSPSNDIILVNLKCPALEPRPQDRVDPQ